MKIAIVHDDFLQWGGAERLVKAWTEIWPEAPIYTSFHTSLTGPMSWLSNQTLKTSFMQHLPFKEKLYKLYFFLYPLAFSFFNFDEYDVVLSSSARFAHGVRTGPSTLHIAYINSPPRQIWESAKYFSVWQRLLLSPILFLLRLVDKQAAQRPDYIIANSKNVAKKIKEFYRREVSSIIYPFVDLERFHVEAESNDYYLVVSRLVLWKRVDIVIQTCNELKLPLKVIGSGEQYASFKRLAGPTVELLGSLTDLEVARYYQKCVSLIHPQEEDFGITPLEALSCGKPVLAYRGGGAMETIEAGVTGNFFYPQTVEALKMALQTFDPTAYEPQTCRNQAGRYSKLIFMQKIQSIVEEQYSCYIRS